MKETRWPPVFLPVCKKKTNKTRWPPVSPPVHRKGRIRQCCPRYFPPSVSIRVYFHLVSKVPVITLNTKAANSYTLLFILVAPMDDWDFRSNRFSRRVAINLIVGLPLRFINRFGSQFLSQFKFLLKKISKELYSHVRLCVFVRNSLILVRTYINVKL